MDYVAVSLPKKVSPKFIVSGFHEGGKFMTELGTREFVSGASEGSWFCHINHKINDSEKLEIDKIPCTPNGQPEAH